MPAAAAAPSPAAAAAAAAYQSGPVWQNKSRVELAVARQALLVVYRSNDGPNAASTPTMPRNVHVRPVGEDAFVKLRTVSTPVALPSFGGQSANNIGGASKGNNDVASPSDRGGGGSGDAGRDRFHVFDIPGSLTGHRPLAELVVEFDRRNAVDEVSGRVTPEAGVCARAKGSVCS